MSVLTTSQVYTDVIMTNRTEKEQELTAFDAKDLALYTTAKAGKIGNQTRSVKSAKLKRELKPAALHKGKESEQEGK